LNQTLLRYVYPDVTLRSYKDAIFGPVPKAVAVARAKKVDHWSHTQPDGTHVVSARLRDGRVIRCVGMPGGERDPYLELRAWIRQL
jgi:hypothetical protein